MTEGDNGVKFLTTKTAAALLGLTADALRYHERLGHVLALKIERGQGQYQRLYVEEDILRFQRQREARALAREGNA
jgi:DNA-binding transcriptional MerR regulator